MDKVTWKDDAPARTETLWGEEEEVKSLNGSQASSAKQALLRRKNKDVSFVRK